MNIVRITVEDPDDLLNAGAFGAGAKVRLESSSDGTSYAEASAQTIVSGTEIYVFYHSAGVASTWYRSRYSDTAGGVFSDYSDAFQVQIGYTDLASVKLQAKITSDNDDAFLLELVDAANTWLRGELLGVFLGPSGDISRTYDMPKNGNVLYIPGGVRTITQIQVRSETGATLQTVTATDYVLRPHAWELLPGMTTDRIEFVDAAGITGSHTYFYRGFGTVVVTGSFGPARVSADLARIATTVAVWMYQSRQAGSGAAIGNFETGELIVNRVLTPFDNRTIRRYRSSLRSFRTI